MLINHEKEHKRTFIIKSLFVIVLLFSILQPIFVSAEPIINDENLEPKEKPGLVEKHLSKFVLNTANSLISIMRAQDVSVLVFQREEVIDESNTTFKNSANATREQMIFGLFPSGLFDGIAQIYDVFNRLIPIPIFVLLTLGGLFMMFDMIKSPENKSRAKEMVLGLIVAVLLIRFGHIAWAWIIKINYFIVDAVYVALKAGGINVTSFISTVWDPTATDTVMKSPSFTTALLVVCALFMTFAMNYQYMMRMIILAMLIVLFPLVLISSIIPSRRSVLNTWFSQFVSQVYIQSAHAVALGLFFFALANAKDLNFWLVLTMFFALPAMSDVVQRIVGEFTGEGGGGGIGRSISNASGMSGLMAVGMMAKGIFQDKGSKQLSNSGNSGNIRNEGKNGLATPLSSSNASDTTLNNHLGGTSGNEGIGSVPVSNGLNNSTRPRGLSRLGSGVANAGKKIANNPQLSKLTKTAAVGGMAVAGAMAGTMVTGNGAKGAILGGSAGMAGAKTGELAKGKFGKGMELGGEVIQSKAEGLNAFAITRDRIGYNDRTQLSDPNEMKRMGQELIGGKLGSNVGSAVGSMSYYGSKLGQKYSESANENYTTVNNKRDVDWSVGKKESQVNELLNTRNNAKQNLDYAAAKYGNEDLRTQDKRKDYNKANVNYLKGEQELRSLKERQALFYSEQQKRKQANLNSIREHANATRNLKSERRSSGQP